MFVIVEMRMSWSVDCNGIVGNVEGIFEFGDYVFMVELFCFVMWFFLGMFNCLGINIEKKKSC